MWVKSPYMYLLYSTYHKFESNQIAILYLVDAVSGLFFGPLIGMVADKYGRKFVSMCYPLLTISNLLLRITGNQSLAYCAQLLTGMGVGILSTAFESWVNYEITNKLSNDPVFVDSFRKLIFADTSYYESFCSILVTIIGTGLFVLYGIFAPIIMSITLAFVSLTIIQLTWDENKPNASGRFIIEQFRN